MRSVYFGLGSEGPEFALWEDFADLRITRMFKPNKTPAANPKRSGVIFPGRPKRP
jgi:hypothetical protein